MSLSQILKWKVDAESSAVMKRGPIGIQARWAVDAK